MSGQQLKWAGMWCKPIGKVRDMADQMKSHMLAAVVLAKGERWQLQEVPVLELLPTQVLVKVCASGISYVDVEQTQGELPGHFLRILGHEVAGDVVAVGDAVTTRTVGDRDGIPYPQAGCGQCEWCLQGRPIMCRNSLEFLRGFLDVAAERLFMAGMHVWNFADFKIGQGTIGAAGMNFKGVFTRDRRPKMAAHFLHVRWVEN
jgi:Alcohol dehydrogenase GroES-like domain